MSFTYLILLKDYFDWLSPLPNEVKVKDRAIGEFDFIHVFVHRTKDL